MNKKINKLVKILSIILFVEIIIFTGMVIGGLIYLNAI